MGKPDIVTQLIHDLGKTDYSPRFRRQRAWLKSKRKLYHPMARLDGWKNRLRVEGAEHQTGITNRYRRQASYYRNLAIENGAKPVDMLDPYDMTICKMFPSMTLQQWNEHRTKSEGEEPY